MHESDSVVSPRPDPTSQRLVLRNTMIVVVAQMVAVPLSVFVNAIIARTLGPTEFGRLYLAMTFASLAFLFVEWGQGGVLTGMVARDRMRAGELLGSGLAWRTVAALMMSALLTLLCFVLDYDRDFLTTLALVLLVSALGTISLACHDVFRGLERLDFGAATYVAWQMLTAAVVVPVLLLGGRLHALLWAQAACAAIGAAYLLRSLSPMGVRKLAIHLRTIKELFANGVPFLVLGLAMALQLNIDAFFLSKLASSEAVGWYAAARKIVGLLIYPASALISALYPTLCRLHSEDRSAFAATAAGAMRATVMVAMPIALGCALFPDLGIRIFSRESYGPAEGNLRWLAIYIFLVYFSMPLGTTLVAAGRQRAWAVTQFGCVAVSAVLNPLLIPWFQEHHHNGGLGVCMAVVISEVLMVGAGFWLLPRDMLGRISLRMLAPPLVAGAAMFAVGWWLSPWTSFVAAPLAVGAYLACLWMTGGIDRQQLQELTALVRSKPA